MFQRLTSLFFSDSSTPEGLEEPKLFVSEEEEEDGWLIIDLPEGPAPVNMESNPMEDLLIEHPSMSVYVTSNSIVVERESPDEQISEGEVPEPRLERHTPHHTTSLTMKATILEKEPVTPVPFFMTSYSSPWKQTVMSQTEIAGSNANWNDKA
ncbi:tumor protein p53-inducible nuclear protein 2 [Alligator mississippiensis]|uniref:Tumor protein p53-inducible nuclear protein 2 n=1 Tax=Alligator mississippiensis TaxID=8496 RepID=A0A151P0R5_ALLMI|nr:tumor protein p53-inducible nuclear protein 2 [Alligator mississippiensis]